MWRVSAVSRLRGGTALNLFIRDMPRLSVDIDLAYLPVQDRETSLTSIHHALKAIAGDITRTVPGANVSGSALSGTSTWCKLVVAQDEVRVKIEVTPVCAEACIRRQCASSCRERRRSLAMPKCRS